MRYVELGRAVRDYLFKNGLTQKEMAKDLNTTQSTLSDWMRHGVTEARAPDVAEYLGIPLMEDFKCEVDYVTVREAAKRLGMSAQLFQYALQQGKFEFGMAVRGRGKSYKYYIYRQPFEEFMEKVKKPQEEAKQNETREIIS